MSGRWIMMCAGEYQPMKIDVRQDDFVVAVDGGLVYLLDEGITPDLLLGDFDSLGEEFAEIVEQYRSLGSDHFLQLPVVKDDTDTMAAARLGIEKGYREFLIYGAMGGRPDHFMANIQSMVWILRNGGQAWMIDRETRMTVIGPGEFRIPAEFEGTVSLFALDSCLEDVTIRGMKYEAEGVTIRNDYPVGCSNETPPYRNGAEALFSIGNGTGLLVLTEKLINRHH